jgi:hypothetical protein
MDDHELATLVTGRVSEMKLKPFLLESLKFVRKTLHTRADPQYLNPRLASRDCSEEAITDAC